MRRKNWLALIVTSIGVLLGAAPARAQTPGPCDAPNTCSIWPVSAVPGTQAVTNDPNAVELGVKFRTTVAGYVTAIRFFKGATNTGTHVVNLWNEDGTLLSRTTVIGESASGWQEVALPSPVAVLPNTTYIASYHTNTGYAADAGYFASQVANGVLTALQDGADGGNGVYVYGATAFPSSTYQSTNYWVDIAFATSLPPDTTPPQVISTSPKNGTKNVAASTSITATFTENIDAATLTTATFEVRNASGALVAGKLTYASPTQTATFQPNNPLASLTTYTATLKGGTAGIKDPAGNAIGSDTVWSFTTKSAPPPPPTTGPGGPILVVTSASNPFTIYYAEILRAEGLNEFAVSDINALTATSLSAYDVVVLGEQPLTAPQVTMLTDWVTAGGNLIAMRPDPQLATLLGLATTGTTLSDAYIQVDTSAAPGAGIVAATVQFHGTADLYTLNGASALATLYSGATVSTTNPAVTVRSVGTAGGQASAFAYDLARSIVYTRQGNPAWSGQERDGFTPIRSDDLFFGGTESNYVDLSKVHIPQADEQQRFLVNLIGFLNADRKPLPRFWYFPRGLKAAIVMTGDDHANNGTAGRFDIYNSNSAPGCVVDNWECIRGTSYIYPSTPLPPQAAAAYVAQGFEIAVHFTTGCNDYTAASLESVFANDQAVFTGIFPDLPPVRTNRTHCVVWSDYDTQPQVELTHGIRLDTDYYYWPATWINDVPGVFTGSGMAQRFTRADGTIVDVYQAATQMTDESSQTYPLHADVLLDRAVGPEGYYGAFVANMHTDTAAHPGSAAIVASAKRHGVPVISAQQLLDWTDGRNASSFSNITWNGTVLSLKVNLWPGTQGIQAMVPAVSAAGSLVGILTGGVPIDYSVETIKGVGYARFTASAATYQARYGVDNVGPAISGLTVVPGGTSVTLTWHTNEPATTKVTYGLSPTALVFTATSAALDTSHAITVTGLSTGTTYYYRVTSADALNNSTSTPTPNGTFTTGPAVALSLVDTTVADFTAGAPDGGTAIAKLGDGELLLRPTAAVEYTGTSLPTGWTVDPWVSGGTATVGNGQVVVEGARLGTDALFGPGSLEFVATFSGQPFQHVGFGTTFNTPPWAIFTTGSGGALYVRTNSGSSSAETLLPSSWLGGPHRFRIDWTTAGAAYWIDGQQVATHAVSMSQPMRLLVSDAAVDGGSVGVAWMRLSPYPTSSTFLSRVMDSQASTTWASAAWTASVPTGTTLDLSARFGDTPTPDATWTTFVPLPTPATTLTQTSRFVQYRAIFSGDGTSTPVLETIAFTSTSAGPMISIDDLTVTEGDTGTSPAVFTLRLSAPMSVPVSVSYATANDTATTADYAATTGTATFTPGQTAVTVAVPIKGDVLVESNETFFLNLTNPVNASIADPQALCTIIENDLTLISTVDVAVAEGNSGVATATFTVSLSKALQVPVTVDYATADVTAVANVDYTPVAGTLTFAAGETQKTILVSVLGDTLNEANESFVVNLNRATNGTITTPQGTATITNDDPVVSATIADLTVTEGTGGTVTAQVPVTLSAAAGQTVSVGYTMTAGTATSADYTSSSGTVTFAAGVTMQTIDIPIVTDAIYEPDETFTVTLRTPVNVTIARTAATVKIVNDDGIPQISITNVPVTEGNTGTTNANFTVTLTNPSSSTIAVNYATADGSALAGIDYNAVSGTLTYTPGQTSKTVTVQVRGDTLDEPDETFAVNLSAPVNATIVNSVGTGTIADNDNPPTIRISDVTVVETDPGVTVDAVLNVTLSAASSFPITVNYATTAGTATSGVDYTAASGTVSFAPGETSKLIAVTVLGDIVNEVNETINVDLTAPVNATIADSRGVVTIQENDPLPSISINDVSVAEGNTGTKTATFTLTLSQPSARSVTVTYATADGTATAGTDYTARTGNLTFAAGATTVTVAITVRGDTTLEPNETVLVNLTAPVNGVISKTTGTLTITNDDQ